MFLPSAEAYNRKVALQWHAAGTVQPLSSLLQFFVVFPLVKAVLEYTGIPGPACAYAWYHTSTAGGLFTSNCPAALEILTYSTEARDAGRKAFAAPSPPLLSLLILQVCDSLSVRSVFTRRLSAVV